jgi:hypothetical protein
MRPGLCAKLRIGREELELRARNETDDDLYPDTAASVC